MQAGIGNDDGRAASGAGKLTLQSEEDGEGPSVDGEDAVAGCSEHEGRHRHLSSIKPAVSWGAVGRARPFIRAAQLCCDYPLLCPLQVQQACRHTHMQGRTFPA